MKHTDSLFMFSESQYTATTPFCAAYVFLFEISATCDSFDQTSFQASFLFQRIHTPAITILLSTN